MYGAGTEGAAESEARIRQGVAAGLVAGLTGAMLAVLLGTATIALLPHDSQLLGWLYPHLSHAATLPAELGAGGNAAGYLLLLLAVPFAGFGVGSIAALIATPDQGPAARAAAARTETIRPRYHHRPTAAQDRTLDNSTEPVVSLA